MVTVDMDFDAKIKSACALFDKDNTYRHIASLSDAAEFKNVDAEELFRTIGLKTNDTLFVNGI